MAVISKWWVAIGCLFLGVKNSHAGDAHHPQINTSITGKIWSKTASPTPIPESTSCSTSTTKSHHYSSIVTTVVPTTLTTTICPTTPTPTPTSVYNPCPTECSVSAGTVELFFWPTNNDFAYPSIYVEPSLGYTFTSPSVYMLINTIGGYNSLGPTGPSATSTIWPFDLGEVSTIDPDSGATRQLTLSDLGTDCPRTAEPSVIATSIAGGPCDPILAAPDDIRSWALPCGACGRFGLFDPPYAVPTVTKTTTPIIITTPPITPTPVPTSTSTTAAPTTLQTASATRGTIGSAWLALSLLASIILL